MIQRLEEEKNVLIKEKKALQKGMNTLQKKLDSLDDPILFIGQYKFGRDDVVDLSHVISMYLVDKPNSIDRNRIYKCVRARYKDLEMGRDDNPEYYYEDVRMLLATCLASNWFADSQRSNMEEWMGNFSS